MSPRQVGAVHRGLSRGLGIMLAATAVLFQRRGLFTWQEAAFIFGCVALQEAYLHIKPLARMRALLIGMYFALPTVMLLATLDRIEPFRGSPLELIQNTPVPVVLLSVQIMVLYVRESARLASIVLVLALFAVVIGLKRPLNDVTWTWLLPIGVIAAAYVAVTFPARTYHALASPRTRASAPRVVSSPAAVARPEYLGALGSACAMVPMLAIALFFFLPRVDLVSKPEAGNIGGGEVSNRTNPRNPSNTRGKDGSRADPLPRIPTVTGMANSVELGDFGDIKRDTTALGGVKVPVRGNAPPLYLRSITFSQFDGQRWTPATSVTGRVTLDTGPHKVLSGGPVRRPRDLDARRYEIELKSAAFGAGGEVPLVAEPVDILELPGAATWDTTTGILTSAEVDHGTRYILNASVLRLPPQEIEARLRGVAPLKAAESLLLDDYWELPEDLRKQIVEKWDPFDTLRKEAYTRADGSGPSYSAYAAARYVVGYFARAKLKDTNTPAYEYSLSKRPDPGPDGIIRFLTTERYGHCEYFASAACAILRAAGIPARLAAGFLTTDYEREKGSYTVYASDAHAWVEIYTDQFGWLAIDPTPTQPPIRPDPANPAPTPADPDPAKPDVPKPEPPPEPDKPPAVDNKPRDPFEAYTPDSQNQLLRSGGEAIGGAISGADNSLKPLTNWMPEFMPSSGIFRALLIAAGPALLLAAWLLRRRERRRKERRVLREMGLPDDQARQRGLYAQLLLLLAAHGYHKRVSETPREFARRVVERGGGFFQPLQPLTELFYLARFSLTKAAGDAEREFKRGLSAFSGQLHRQAKASPAPPVAGAGSSA